MKFFRRLSFFAFLTVAPIAGYGQSASLGVGALDCQTIIGMHEDGSDRDKAALESWIAGFWSATTAYENDTFDETILESYSNDRLYTASIGMCRQRPLDILSGALIKLLNNMD